MIDMNLYELRLNLGRTGPSYRRHSCRQGPRSGGPIASRERNLTAYSVDFPTR
jgi:hypothetical protein